MRWTQIIEYAIGFVFGAAALAIGDAPPWAFALWAAVLFSPLLVFTKGRNYADAYMRLMLPLVFGALFVVVFFAAHENPIMRPILEGQFDDFDQYIGEQYYSVISTLFAIITALILVKGIESFDRLNAAIVEEANQVRSIVEFLYYFEEEEGGAPHATIAATRIRTARIRAQLETYCALALSDPSASKSDGANGILHRTTRLVGGLVCVDDNDKLALAEVMRGLNQLFSIRARRVACSRARVPFYMLVSLGFMSLAIILPFFIGRPEQNPYNPAIIFVLTTFCVFILMLLRDINTPFEGFWRVDMSPMTDLSRDLETRRKIDAEEDAGPPGGAFDAPPPPSSDPALRRGRP